MFPVIKDEMAKTYKLLVMGFIGVLLSFKMLIPECTLWFWWQTMTYVMFKYKIKDHFINLIHYKVNNELVPIRTRVQPSSFDGLNWGLWGNMPSILSINR